MEDKHKASGVEQAFQVFVRIRPVIRRETEPNSTTRHSNPRNVIRVQENEVRTASPPLFLDCSARPLRDRRPKCMLLLKPIA